MKFLKSKGFFQNQLKNADAIVKRNWHRLSKDKKQEYVLMLWTGIIPELPNILKPFEQQIKQGLSLGTEGVAWDLIIKETKDLIDNDVKYNTEWRVYFKKLITNFYSDYEFQDEQTKKFNFEVRQKLLEFEKEFRTTKTITDKTFFKETILPDLEKSKLEAFQRHLEKHKI